MVDEKILHNFVVSLKIKMVVKCVDGCNNWFSNNKQTCTTKFRIRFEVNTVFLPLESKSTHKSENYLVTSSIFVAILREKSFKEIS